MIEKLLICIQEAFWGFYNPNLTFTIDVVLFTQHSRWKLSPCLRFKNVAALISLDTIIFTWIYIYIYKITLNVIVKSYRLI